MWFCIALPFSSIFVLSLPLSYYLCKELVQEAHRLRPSPIPPHCYVHSGKSITFVAFCPQPPITVCSGNSFPSTPPAGCFFTLFPASLELICRRQQNQRLPLLRNTPSTLNFAITLSNLLCRSDKEGLWRTDRKRTKASAYMLLERMKCSLERHLPPVHKQNASVTGAEVAASSSSWGFFSFFPFSPTQAFTPTEILLGRLHFSDVFLTSANNTGYIN